MGKSILKTGANVLVDDNKRVKFDSAWNQIIEYEKTDKKVIEMSADPICNRKAMVYRDCMCGTEKCAKLEKQFNRLNVWAYCSVNEKCIHVQTETIEYDSLYGVAPHFRNQTFDVKSEIKEDNCACGGLLDDDFTLCLNPSKCTGTAKQKCTELVQFS